MAKKVEKELKMGFEIGNWNIEANNNGKGFIQNFDTNVEAIYFVGHDFQISIFNMQHTQNPLPQIPKHIKSRIIALERYNRKIQIENLIR